VRSGKFIFLTEPGLIENMMKGDITSLFRQEFYRLYISIIKIETYLHNNHHKLPQLPGQLKR